MNINITTKLDQELVNLLQYFANIKPETVTIKEQRKLNNLVKVTLKLPYLKHRHFKFTLQDYQEGLTEALGTLTVKNIQHFLQLLQQNQIELNLENSSKIRQYYVNRLNKISYYKTVDYLRQNPVLMSLDHLINQENDQSFLELVIDNNSSQLWEKMIETENQQKFYHTISNQNLINIYPQNYPKANLQAIIMLRLKQEKWRNIAQKLHIPQGTLTAFYWRIGKPFLKQQLIFS